MKTKMFTLVLFAASLAWAQPYPAETADAQDLIATTDKLASYHYCVEGTLTCRTLVLLKSKATGLRVPHFYDVFLSSERAVGSTGYFMQNSGCNTFRAFLDDVFDGTILINYMDMDNQALSVIFDNHHMPTVSNLHLKRLGTTRYVLADMSFKHNKATIIGNEYDTANPAYSVPVSVTYKRVQR
jgi:hypothetical protein